ncbi:pimeloyl-ACP methyl ester esterase BioH [Chiayiivirga flava]|uniref:Pimeloyl-[acyl-carrier protein] methyl ester esterase n=1 Tax=Chiayiivirga flava TaxID=659595 RepID=A0A7W8FZX0_9GAMM|nr:pimeloyl-[acyl-carrier protein] methyl ester esterase [Chiayiivirga flava]
MFIESIGQGPALVLIHGWAMHAGIFAPLTARLAERFEVFLVDLPGHGRSAERDVVFDPLDCATRIAAQVPAATWVGWSLGGLVALHAALSQPRKVTTLVEIAANPRFVLADDWPHGVDAAVFRQFADGLRDDWKRTIERFLALEAHGSERMQAELRELKANVFARGEPALSVLQDGLRTLDRSDLRAELPRLAMPSLWIAGRRDRLVPPAAMQWAAAQAPRGEFLEVSAGHAPFLTHPERVAGAIDAFAAGHAAV